MWWLCSLAVFAADLDWGDEEIVVTGETEVREARRALVDKLRSLGFRPHRRNGQTVFAPPERWMGRFVIDDEGWVHWRKPLATFDDISLGESEGINATGQAALPMLGAIFSFTPAQPRVRAWVYTEVADAIDLELDAYQEALEGRALAGHLQTLPERLDALWTHGTALDGGAVVPEASRAATVLDYWVSRSDTVSGRAAARTVGAWIRGVLQQSPAALPRWALQQAETRRGDGVRLYR